ncbi:MAG: CoA-binding protein [Desulfarculaceae bacterium]|nr:CoA-binding protein [Desulfarculaceae bacterium]MCF8071459.1 CoA-binding protein [Desulfarculaceae bacterium]MCF8103413.1 CoA-binding protein [Desulfarculaceae bacterium]MCF8118180.1 CoA-binding protein [Desulfarculaceae bacterium]
MSLNTRPDNPGDAPVKQALQEAKRIAVVGLSPKPFRASHQVAEYLQNHGYEIIPVNPTAEEILGAKCYPDLESIPGQVDVVDVFRRSEMVPPVAQAAAGIGAKVLWLQLDVIHDQAAQAARQAGLLVVQDACLKVEHHRLL